MGFLDKAKAMAEQAQQKLDEVQKDFNAKQAGGSATGTGTPPVQYDSAGRPVGADAPAEVPMEPAATGAAPEATVQPASPAQPAAGFEPAPPVPVPPAAPSGDPLAEAAPPAPATDQPPSASPSDGAAPGLTSGDPLAG